MSNKISSVSKILLLVAAAGLVMVLFTPMWRIDLDAPQYPEGLRLTIYANGLRGNVDIINGLNHYIGMKTLHSEDFFEFKILTDPNELRKLIEQKTIEGYNARLLAGFAWEWTQENKGNSNAQVNDVKIPELNFEMPWNSRKKGDPWAINKEGINQIGCVHTSQGLEFDYVGIIVGNDLKFNFKTNEFYTEWDSYRDSKGKQGLRDNPERLNKMIRNIYRILMTRGIKGCYIYFTHKSTEEYFINRLNKT